MAISERLQYFFLGRAPAAERAAGPPPAKRFFRPVGKRNRSPYAKLPSLDDLTQRLGDGDFVFDRYFTHGAVCALKKAGRLGRLNLPIPVDLQLLDLGGALVEGACPENAPFTAVASYPLRNILQGLLFPEVWRRESIPVSFRDLLHGMLTAPPDALNGRCEAANLAIAARNSVYLHFRLGYHSIVIDARYDYDKEKGNRNHIDFRFWGGATNRAKRSRRAQLIAEIMTAFDFKVQVKSDLIHARAADMPEAEMVRTLDIIGRLIGFTRQLDVRLDTEAAVARYVEAFLSGDYSVASF